MHVSIAITSPPSNIASTGVTSSSIGLTWGQASSHLEGNTTYSLSYSANSASVSALYSEAIYSYKLDNLTSCVTHWISIKAINPVGTGPVGSIAVTTLPAGECHPIRLYYYCKHKQQQYYSRTRCTKYVQYFYVG